MRDTFFWSDADKDRLAELLTTGISARKIAAHFEGASRNAVIGVIHRDKRLKAIGLSGRATRQPTQPTTTTRVSPTVIRRIKSPVHTKPRPTPKPDLVAPAPLDLMLHEIGNEQCKWPVNDPPKGGAFLFCGHQRAEKGPYCPYHKKRAFRVDLVDR